MSIIVESTFSRTGIAARENIGKHLRQPETD